LRAGALPKGGKIVKSGYVEPIDDSVQQWLARGTLALGGGALIGLLAWMVVRMTRPVRRRFAARFAGPAPSSRLLVTLIAPVAIFVVTRIFALGIDSIELEHIITKGGDGWFASSAGFEQFSFGALGIMPVINAFIFVEILAVIFPGWRRRRHAGPDARAPLSAAVLITAATLLFIQSWFITQYLYGLERAGVEVLAPGIGPRMLVITSFAIGTLVLTGVASLIREHGLGNGFGALLASGFLLGVLDRWDRLEGLIDGDFVVGGMTFLAIAIPIAIVMRWRVARLGEAPLRLPTSGGAPLGELGGVVFLIALLAKLPFEELTFRLYDWSITAREHHSILIAAIVLLTLLWSWAFARPNVTRKLAERIGLIAPARASWWAAAGLSAALLLLVGATAMLTTIMRPSAAWLADAMTVAIATVVVLDIYDDWRARRIALDRVWTLHQAQHTDLVARALDDAGIPHHFTSANLRTLLAFFGPFAGIDVLVPPEHAPAARQRLRELFE
ncbi:MAG TPA: hypothetical protein VIV11_41560, partial [Kofleriaceae bacterium]